LGAHRCGVGMSLLSALVPSSFLSGSSPHWPYSLPPEPPMRIASNLQKYMTERTRREPVPLTPGVGAARVVHREAMPPANGRLDDPDAGEGVDGPRAALRLGLRRVPERAVKSCATPGTRVRTRACSRKAGKGGREARTHAIVLADGEEVAAAGDDGGEPLHKRRQKKDTSVSVRKRSHQSAVTAVAAGAGERAHQARTATARGRGAMEAERRARDWQAADGGQAFFAAGIWAGASGSGGCRFERVSGRVRRWVDSTFLSLI
jgi:hypothetical protein